MDGQQECKTGTIDSSGTRNLSVKILPMGCTDEESDARRLNEADWDRNLGIAMLESHSWQCRRKHILTL